MKGIERTVAKARDAVKVEPTRWKVALTYQDCAPQTFGASVRLYATIKGAEEDLRELVKGWEAEGFKREYGGLGAGAIKMSKGDEVRSAYLQRRP